MSLLFVTIAVVFTVAMTWMMIRPFSADDTEQWTLELLDEKQRQIEALVSRKVALVQSLRDIEYDWETNKISEEDYQRFKKSCERQAVGIMRRLDDLHGGDRDWDEFLDRQIAERLGDTTSSDTSEPTSPDTDSVEPGGEPPPGCRNCDAALDPEDRFCSRCGTPVDADDPSSGVEASGDDFTPLEKSSSSSEVAG